MENQKLSKKSYFYVLSCHDGTLYGGYTTDIKRRVKEHNSGIGAKYTRVSSRRPVKMIYAEEHISRSQATKAEAAFKKRTRKAKESYLKQNGVNFPFNHQEEGVVVKMEEAENG